MAGSLWGCRRGGGRALTGGGGALGKARGCFMTTESVRGRPGKEGDVGGDFGLESVKGATCGSPVG